jgi:hypothetical protein
MPFPKIDEGYSSLSSTGIESYRYVMVVCRERPCRFLTFPLQFQVFQPLVDQVRLPKLRPRPVPK